MPADKQRIDQRDNAFWRRKYGEAALPVPPPDGAGESADPLQRILFGERRRGNCVNEWVAGAVDGLVRPDQHSFATPEHAARHLKEICRYFGADLVGVTAVDPAFVYTHAGHESGAAAADAGRPIDLPHKYAVVMGFAMDYRLISSSPSYIDAAEVGRGYARAGAAAVTVAAYIRELGWPARAHTVRSEQVLHIPLAVAAGLGELGRNGLLITARYGPRLRLATVTTDLPLAVDSPVDLGVQAFCRVCLKCSRCCPSHSIGAGEPSEVRGVRKWAIGGDECLAFWESAPAHWCNCNVCIKVCPWNKPDTWWHGLAAGAIRRAPWLARPMLLLDDLLYGRNPRPHVRFLEYDNRKPSPWVKPD